MGLTYTSIDSGMVLIGWDPSLAWSGPQLGDLRAGGLDKLDVQVGVAPQTPGALGRLGKLNPGPVGQGRVARGGRDQIGQLSDDLDLLVPIECAGVGEHVDA